jgi:hypothetical protein
MNGVLLGGCSVVKVGLSAQPGAGLREANDRSPPLKRAWEPALERAGHGTLGDLGHCRCVAQHRGQIRRPYLPRHVALWGGEAAAIVQPLNPLLSDEREALQRLPFPTRFALLDARRGGGKDGREAGQRRCVPPASTAIAGPKLVMCCSVWLWCALICAALKASVSIVECASATSTTS